MRFEGVLTSWNDDRGFGFILSPKAGGKDVFLHVSAYPAGGRRPGVGQRLSFELVFENGRPRAAEVELVGADFSRSAPSPRRSSLLAIFALVGLYLWVDGKWGVPAFLPLLYAVASFITFFAYAIDKSAAQSGRWRIQESTLHLFSLAGGWPGAIVAQVVLRHKSQKAAFRFVFWLTVLINCGVFCYYSSR